MSVQLREPSKSRLERRRVGAYVTIAVAALLAPEAVDAATLTCEGFAPFSTACSTGTRKRVEGLSHNVTADFNYFGTLESSIEWSGGTRLFRCTYTQTGPRSCLSSGTFPPIDATFTHRCRSLLPGSVITGVNPKGTEGGAGNWQCEVTV